MQVSQADLAQIAGEGSTRAVQPHPKNSKEEAAETAIPEKEGTRTDTVKLSLYAQAKRMREQGDTITEIARKLSLDVKTVNGYFDIEDAAVAKIYTPSPATPDPTPSPQAQASSKTSVAMP